MTFLSVRDLSIHMGEFCLDFVSLDIQQGDYVTIMGPTGAGKSILLECIIGFYKPEQGRILLDNSEITREPPERRKIGIVYQDYALLPHLSVFQNIEYGLKKVDKDKARRARTIRELTGSLNISHLLHRKPGTLSGGEQQRTALARALVVQPRMLLMDEPLSALDPNTRHSMRRLLREVLKDRGITVLHVTHDLEDVWGLADKVAILKQGRLMQYDTLHEVFNRPCNDFIADFVGASRYKGTLLSRNGNGVTVGIGGLRLATVDRAPSAGKDAVAVAIRPENVHISREIPSMGDLYNVFAAELEDMQHQGMFSLCTWRAEGARIRSLQPTSNLNEMALAPREICYLSIACSNVRFVQE